MHNNSMGEDSQPKSLIFRSATFSPCSSQVKSSPFLPITADSSKKDNERKRKSLRKRTEAAMMLRESMSTTRVFEKVDGDGKQEEDRGYSSNEDGEEVDLRRWNRTRLIAQLGQNQKETKLRQDKGNGKTSNGVETEDKRGIAPSHSDIHRSIQARFRARVEGAGSAHALGDDDEYSGAQS